MRRNISIWMAIATLAAGLTANAAPRWVRVSLTEDPATSMSVAWNTDAAGDSVVQYGLDTSYGQETVGISQNVGGDLGVIHEVQIVGLTPDTTYHYRVGNATDGWSDDQLFATAPADECAPFSFGITADNRADGVLFHGASLCWSRVLDAIGATGVDFLINTGDLVEEGKNRDEWADYLEKSDAWMSSIAIMPSIGNHDDDDVDGDGAYYNKVFALPRNSNNSQEDFYSFDYGNIHFVCLSSDTFSANHMEMQRQWLEADLAATDRMWKVVYFHPPVYSSGDHGTDEDGNNAYLIPIFDAHHVDMVISGHDHIYERYRPFHGGQEVGSYDDGTCYLVSGGGGAPTDPIYAGRPKEDGLEVGDARHHFVRITVTNNVMHVKAERVSGGWCLQGGTGIIDEFDIVKTLADDPCQGPTDADGDGHSPPGDCCDDGSESAPGCDQGTAASMYPGAQEICGDGIDQNCDGGDEACPCDDADGDGYQDAACAGQDGDCDDADPEVNPGVPEACADGVDNDCDGDTDEGDCENCVDADGDGYFAAGAECPSGNDCDDANAEVNPGVVEVCNGIDDECDGETDDDGACDTGCVDSDGDGHDAPAADCPSGDDCDDDDAGSYPGAEETCGDGVDQDCSGEDLQCGCADADLDGHEDAACGGDDCDDAEATVHPGAAEACNLVDDDCDATTDEDLGTKTCGAGACASSTPRCLDGATKDCVPLEPPEAEEATCDDGVDNDCDGYTDADDSDCTGSEGCGCGDAAGARSAIWLVWAGMLLIFRRRW